MRSERKKKSVVIPTEELREFRKLIRKFHTFVDGEEKTGISRDVLRNLQLRNTCAPETLDRIKNYITAQSVA